MKVILTEGQLNQIIQEEVILEGFLSSLLKLNNMDSIVKKIAIALIYGAISFGAVPKILDKVEQNAQGVAGSEAMTRDEAIEKIKMLYQNVKNKEAQVAGRMKTDAQEQASLWKNNYGTWKLVSDDVLATVYNAVPQQCNKDVAHTASMFKLNLTNVLSQRVIAMERTFMKELGLKYGDVVYVEGTEKWDGPWQIQDTMNKRFAGMHKIDILVPRNIKTGKWDGVKISVPADQQTEANAKSSMKGSA
jgi:uncharacterized cupin superfamily protein